MDEWIRDCEEHGKAAILQEVQERETRSSTSLFDMSEMRLENGPPLPLACDLCWTSQLQGVHFVSGVYEPVLLDGLLGQRVVGLAGVQRSCADDAGHVGRQYHLAFRPGRDNRIGPFWFHCVAHLSGAERTDHD